MGYYVVLDLGTTGWPAADPVASINVCGVFSELAQAEAAERECRDSGQLTQIHELPELDALQGEY